ncbi:MAG: CPBP family intramembrane glutamic endopeptidase [Bacteroidota bacterium]
MPTLLDPWDPHRPIPLTGWLERHRFSPAIVFVLITIVAFVAYVAVSNVLTLVMLFARGVTIAELQGNLSGVVAEQLRPMFVANSMAQFLVLGIPALFLARLHTPDGRAYLRLRMPDSRLLGLSVLCYLCAFPLIQWVASLNAAIPIPDALQAWEASQLMLIEAISEQQVGIVFSLLTVAVTPAICEELIFRGYLQRNLDRVVPAAVSIIIIGILFGVYHLRFSQVLPLSALGVYFAYVTWRTGSLWPAILIHFIHNGAMVLLGQYIQQSDTISAEQVEQMVIPWYVIAICIGGVALLAKLMQQRAERLIQARRQLA